MEDINAHLDIGDEYELTENELYQIEQILAYRSMREEENTDVEVE